MKEIIFETFKKYNWLGLLLPIGLILIRVLLRANATKIKKASPIDPVKEKAKEKYFIYTLVAVLIIVAIVFSLILVKKFSN